MDTLIYGSGRSGASEMKFSTFSKSAKSADEDESFRTAQQARYGAPQSFLQESAEMMERQQGDEDVFDQFRRKNISEKESDYHARWRKRAALSPEREDPFASKQKSQQQQQRRAKSMPAAAATAAIEPAAAPQREEEK